jgi:hypothetical protein
MERMAHSLVKSRMFGLENVDQALSLMAIAQAEGKHPAIIARDFHMIQNRPAKKAEAMLRDFCAAGGTVKWHQLDDGKADATFSHPAGGTVRIAWDMDRAKRAGLCGKPGGMYDKYPRQMLRSRTVSEGVRTVAPFATSGVYTPEEVHDMAEAAPAELDVTPAPTLDIEGHVTAIFAADSMAELKAAYRHAYNDAKDAADVMALERFESAKDKRKLELSAEEVPHE